MYLSDSHVHLHAYRDAHELLERARRVGVALIVGIAVDLPSARRTIDIARHNSGVVAAVGLHPSHLKAPLDNATLADLESLARDPAVGFIGEIGLDAIEANVGIDVQRAAFAAQVELARKLNLPVNLHVRGAFDEAFDVLARAGIPDAGAVLHYFADDTGLARRALDLGLFLSVGKPVTREENEHLRQAIATVPLDRLLLETDSYPLPGRTTEPADLGLVAMAIARLLGCPVERIAEVTTANLLRMLPVNLARRYHGLLPGTAERGCPACEQ